MNAISQRTAEHIIVGGGVIGLSVAYHLAKAGARDVLLLERNTLTSGTSWHAAGIVGPLRSNINLTKLAIYGTELFRTLEEETGQATGYQQTGGYWLAQTEDRLEELKRIAGLGLLTGLTPEILSANDLASRVPHLHTDDLAGALFVAEDGQVNPVDLCMAYAKGARTNGVQIEDNTPVARISIEGQKVRGVILADGTHVQAGTVIICAGAWSNLLGTKAAHKLRVPLQAVEHMYIVSEPLVDAPTPFPILRDLDARIYIKGDAGKLVLGGFEPNAKTWNAAGPSGDTPFLELPEDWDQFEPFMTAGLHRWPDLAKIGVQHFMNGPESFTPDTRQLMGNVPEIKNLYVAAGMNSIGIMSSAGVGKVMAEWMIDGTPAMDLSDVEYARLDPTTGNKTFLSARVQEAVGDQFAMHWPHKQPNTGRGVKRTPLHDANKQAGGVFGAPAGWERPLWFGRTPEEMRMAYSYGTQSWWGPAAHEAEAVRDSVALYDLTPFTKIDITGPDALPFLQIIAAGNVDIDIGRTVYTPLLNTRGGIEADVTITRFGVQFFRITSGAASRWRDLSRLATQRDDLTASVHIVDRTSHEAVLGVMGPQAHALLSSISDNNFSFATFPFGTSQIVDIGMARARATRLSYMGESGFELSMDNDVALHIHETIVTAGLKHQLAHAGLFSLDACRIEKGFRHWGHDIGPDDTPIEAGLGFTIDWKKPENFIGRDTLLRQHENGIQRSLMQFVVTEDELLLLHDEPIYRDGTLVGQTTSGARGFRTGQNLCLGWMKLEAGELPESRFDGNYQIDVAARKYPLTPLRRAAYDPSGEKMRGGKGNGT